MVSLTPFMDGLKAAYDALDKRSYSQDPRSDFYEELSKAGYKPDGVISLNHITRITDPFDKPRKQTGWYWYDEFEISGNVLGVGIYGTWHDPDNKTHWTSRSLDVMSAAERAAYSVKFETAKAAREAEEQARFAEAAARANELWSQFKAATPENAYLAKKGIARPFNTKQAADDGALVVPITFEGAIVSLQFDYPDHKKNMTGGRMKGGYSKIEGNAANVYICEGWATGASIAEATGATVYCAMSAGNLYEIAAMAKGLHGSTSRITVAADDDVYTEVGNAGREKGTQAAHGLGLAIAFPVFKHPCTGRVDFNDLHQAEGLEAVRQCLGFEATAKAYEKPKDEDGGFVEPPTGFISDVFNYYNATSGAVQKGFAIQTALAIASVVCSRAFKTSNENYTSMFFLNVGKSGTGKEHARTVTDKILFASGCDQLISGDGYKSAGSLFSALLDKPRHISLIDEYGRYLEAGKSSKRGGDANGREANTKIMEVFTRSGGIFRAPNYSTMTLKKEAAEVFKNRFIHNPALTILATTTPSTLFDAIDIDSVRDGFFGRFLMCISDAKRDIRRHVPSLSVPESIISWVKAINERADNQIHSPFEAPNIITIPFTQDALALDEEFQKEFIALDSRLEAYGLQELTMRPAEVAMRVSLIVALARNPKAKIIGTDDLSWAQTYVRNCFNKMVRTIRMKISNSDFERDKKDVLQALRDSSPEWVKFSTMNKASPYSKHQRKYLTEILDALVDAELIDMKAAQIEGRGRPTKEYRAIV